MALRLHGLCGYAMNASDDGLKRNAHMKMKGSSRARGGNRGGCGGGYERTDPDFEVKRIARMKDEYLSLDTRWRQTYLDGLAKADQFALDRLLHPQKYV